MNGAVVRGYAMRLLGFAVFVLVVFVAARTLPARWNKWFPKDKKDVFVPTAVAKKGDLLISVKQLGTVEAEHSILVSSEIDGKIIYLIPEGKNVKKGDLLVQLDDTPLITDVQNDTLALKKTQADVQKANLEMQILKESNKTNVEQQQAQLSFDQTELERSKAKRGKQVELAKEHLVPQTTADDADMDVQAKQFTVDKDQKDLILKREQAQNNESQKQADVDNAVYAQTASQRTLDQAVSKLSKAKILAPGAGLVVIIRTWMGDGIRKFKEGDTVYPSRQIIRLPDLSSMLVNAQVDEADIARVRTGQKVRISLDALPGKFFSGHVQEISKLATEAMPWEASSTGPKNFAVTIKVDKTGPSPLRPGMTANVEIIADDVRNCVSIPIEAVFDKEGKRVVYVKAGSAFRAQVVVTGKKNENSVQTKSGLKAGDAVALIDPTRPSGQSAPESTPSVPLPAPTPARAKSK